MEYYDVSIDQQLAPFHRNKVPSSSEARGPSIFCRSLFNRFQRICGIIRKHLKKIRTDTQMKFFKVVSRPTLLYGSETWVTTKRDMTRLEAAEMRFLRSVKGYTRLDKIRSEVIRKNQRSLESKTWDPNTNKTGSTILKDWTTPDFQNTPSTTNLGGEEIVDAPGNDGNASMPEQVKRPNPWRKMMMMTI